MRNRPTSLQSISLAIAAVTAFAAAPAAAAPGLVVTRAEGAAECPDAAALAESVAKHMGHLAFDAAPPPGSDVFTVEIARGGLYTARIRSRVGERELSDPGPGCGGLSDALALTLAILLDPEGRPPEPSPRARPPPPAAPPPPPPTADVPRPERAALELGGALTVGVVGSAAPAVAGALDLRPSSVFSLALGVLAAPAHALAFDAGPGSLSLSLVAATLRPCAPELGRSTSFRLRACADLLFGALSATPSADLPAGRSATVFWFAAGPSSHLDGKLWGPIGWSLGAELLFIRPQTFVVDPSPSFGLKGGRKDLSSVDLIISAGLRASIF